MECWLEHFIPFIQFMGAVNIVYIATHFPTKVYNLIFNKDKIENELSELGNKIHAGAGAVQAMGYMTMNDGKTNKAEVDRLKEDYLSLLEKWNAKQNEINDEIETARNVKGAKSLFLYTTLYCMLILLAIAAFAAMACDFFRFFIIVLNIVVTICSFYFTCIVWRHQWDKKGDKDCYRTTFMYFTVQVIVVFILAGICVFLQRQCFECWSVSLCVTSCLSDLFFLLCVVLPAYPCFMSVVFIFMHEKKINKLKGNMISDFKGKQKCLDGRKRKFEEMEEMFTIPESMTFGK